MEVLLLTVFVSLALAGLGVALFVWSARNRTFEHADRLSILPLEAERVRSAERKDLSAPLGSTRRGGVQ